MPHTKLKQIDFRSVLTEVSLVLFGIGLVSYVFDLSPIIELEWLFFGAAIAFIISRGIGPKLTEEHALPDNPLDSPVTDKPGFWTPVAKRAASFKTQRLKRQRDGSVAVQTTLGLSLFSLITLLAGLGIMLAAILPALMLDGALKMTALIPLVVGGLFIRGSIDDVRPKDLAIFDTSRMEYRMAGEDTQESAPPVPFSQIQGLQLLKDFHQGSRFIRAGRKHSDRFTSFELNLVTEQNDRINVLSHGDLPSIIIDAKGLAERLDVPIWHRL